MYEKSKRGKGNSAQKQKDGDKDGKNRQSKAIIVTWNIKYGDCELQTYALNDKNKQIFVLHLNCI